MPARLTPDMPARVAAAQRAISSTARLTVLRFLLGNPGSTRAEVSTGAGIGSKSTWVALKELQELGFVDVTQDAGTGPGANHRFSVDGSRLSEDLGALVAWITQPL